LREGPSRPREQAEAVFTEPCRFECWPQIPIRVIASADDRFFPLQFQRRVAMDRLKTETEVETEGGVKTGYVWCGFLVRESGSVIGKYLMKITISHVKTAYV
jgi:hypothetical protein